VDPGVRTPFTIYSPQGSVAEIGYNATKVLDKLINRIARRKKRLQQVIAEVHVEKETRFLDHDKKLRQRNRIRRAKRAYHESEDKAKRVIKDFHYKAAHYLCQRYHTIILPYTSSHHWRVGKRLAVITKKRSMTLRTGLFSSRLIQTATKYSGSVIKRGSEAYTSKQCGACGTLNEKLGGSKKFVCKSLSCGASGDRDIHAARNILLRFLQD
jgi:putative transposase